MNLKDNNSKEKQKETQNFATMYAKILEFMRISVYNSIIMNKTENKQKKKESENAKFSVNLYKRGCDN